MEEKEELAPQANGGEEKSDKRRRYLRDIGYIGMMAAILAVCSWLTIPVGEIAITLQTLGVCLAAGLLGWKRGTVCVAVYILLGICGIPVFSGFKNFYALLAGPSAGYVVGFLFTAVIVGVASDLLHLVCKDSENKILRVILQLTVLAVAMVIGVAICYVFGTMWYLWIYKGSATAENLQIALTYCVYPFIVPDLIKIIVATFLVYRLKRYVK